MRSNLVTALFVGILSFVVLLPGTASMSLWDRDEACNAQCAREMLQRKDFIVPTFNSRLRTDKPPLEYWAMMASYSLLGINEFAARLPSVLFSVGTILLVFIFGGQLWGKEVGLLASLIMLSSIHFPIVARAATPDPAFIFFLTFALFLFLRGRITLGYTASALATLAKGPLGIIIPLGTLSLYLLFSEGWKGLRKAFSLKGIFLFLVIALPWYVVVDIKTHHQFYKGFILYHNLTRFIKPIGGHRGPVFYYLLVLPLAFIPWSILLPKACLTLFQKAEKEEGVYLFIYLWILFPFALFSLAKTKLPNYILPIYPALALSMAYALHRYGGEVLGPLRVPLKGFYLIAGFMLVLLVVTPYLATPRLEQKKLSPAFAKEIRAEIKEKDLIVTHPFSIPSLVFYTNHKVIREKKRSALKAFLISHRSYRIFVITKPRKLEFINHVWKGRVKVMEAGYSLYPHGRLVLALLSPTHHPVHRESGGKLAKQKH